ncbi:diaminopropionate ammonia-lyase [Cupriavidus sp. WKF15]|uniref:diaminopropionate ammonia-lyase n=1 Tax=Cupriavidus sp. WKF15 TaxID=3032282 RepID=UPI0023E1E218|nr:diaminopropionate ammonia-lyase [Cupriavidus sp. WKF15]WER50569.1 diaminopropionate ammonia-lyase [Cupriavidus sp. WKF15]
MPTLPQLKLDLFVNPARSRSEPYGGVRETILGAAALAAAQQAITAWDGYQVTPLHALPALATMLGVGAVHYKDEGTRFGLGSFKALGGAYAVGRLLAREIGKRVGRDLSPADLGAPDLRKLCADYTVTCATDGNHGRSVAWGARQFGANCVIYIHATVSEGRKAAIEQFGATVARTTGNYDDAVRQADRDAGEYGWHVISDTSYPGYMDVPRDVMQGYQVMIDEAVGALTEWPTHVFVQAGVGGFAAAVCGYFWERDMARRPVFVVVEPQAADCLSRSARAGRVTAVTGELDTLMAGLACGEVSLLAWEILAQGADAYCTIDDTAAVATMRLLANPAAGDPTIVAGESAVAGLAAAIAAMQDPQARSALGLGADSRLLFIGSEADTDAELYARLVGRSADAVRNGARA